MLLFSLGIYDALAQTYTKDSLQFKVYTIISFKNSHLKDIKIDRIFCDYCSDSQLTALRQLGYKLSKKLAKKPKNRVDNGQNRLAIYLRIARKDFANIRRKDTIK